MGDRFLILHALLIKASEVKLMSQIGQNYLGQYDFEIIALTQKKTDKLI